MSTKHTPGVNRLQPVCEAGGDKYTEYYGGSDRKDEQHRIPCPVCRKIVKLKKQGLDRFPSTIPHHHKEMRA
jgi:hypothetical protein